MENKAEVALLIADKTDFKTKTVTRHKEGHCVTLKRSIPKENITLVNIHATYKGEPKHIKKILLDFEERLTAIHKIS